MSDCCAKKSETTHSYACPECHQFGKSISLKTLYHNVRFPENQQILADSYFYCANKSCAVAYFSISGKILAQYLLSSAQAQAIEADKLCYCFDISAAQYRSALKDNIAERVKNFVIEQTKTGLCACEIRNPSGQCCLAKFKQIDKKVTGNASE
ncbi:hypothetical protein AU255_13085 [Methyloprofundus sedimenti]|uniref:CopZ zinc binding domain-containing protein n=1 Tax=Methyloprofundus sedimenti TaxID=1420851 RepID=A0A1V8M3D1_9GAMM|nr:hypothetical protein [Methyloprofundus sedimenti]OQK16042.1 hypothetical protein AU255_13085 [Methyloprofundus sedimenti]